MNMKVLLCGVLSAFIVLCASCENRDRQDAGTGKAGVIAVSGAGTVMAQPDTVQMSISLGKTAPTTSQAQEAVNVMVKEALAILHDTGIEDKNISTTSLRFFPEYEWGGSQRVLLGQKAEQVIAFSIDNIMSSRVSDIIDRLIHINGIELQQMQFSVKDNTKLYAQSRELAYRKAIEKAEQYAGLAGMKIVKTLSIAEDGMTPVSPVYNRAMKQADAFSATAAAGSASALPSGEMEITSRIQAEFLME
jgi:uncharacterized protein YggE